MIKFLKLALCLTFLLLITSCSKNKKMLQMIPEDAAVVAEFNTASIIKNSGVEIKDGKVVLPNSIKELMSDDQKKELDQTVEKLKGYDVDYSSNIYMFVDKNVEETPFYILIPVNDEEKCAKAFTDDNKSVKFTESDGMRYFSDEQMGAAIKDNVLMITMLKSCDQKNYLNVATQKFEHDYKCIVDNENSKNCIGDGKDINVFINYKSLSKVINKTNPQSAMFTSYLADMDASKITVDLSDNQIATNVETVADDNCDYMKLMNKVYAQNLSNKFLNLMPQNANLIFAMSINGAEIANFEQVKNVLAMLGESGNQIKEMIASINGTFAFGAAYDVANNKYSYSVAIPSVSADNIVSVLLPLLQDRGQVYSSNGYAVIKISSDNSDVALNYSAQTESAKMFSENKSAILLEFPYKNMKMYSDFKSTDLKHASGVFYILDANGEKMSFLDYSKFFSPLFKEIESNQTYSMDDYSTEDDVPVEDPYEYATDSVEWLN